MCGRFARTFPAAALARLLGLDGAPELPPRYNVAPTQPVATARLGPQGGRELALLRWGLVPAWSADPRKGFINARAETAAAKPAFRSAFKQRRCLVPADAFFEWQAEGGRKQPYLFRRRDGAPFAFAGLWERWQGRGGEALETCCILTTGANEVVAPVHDRMPVILRPEDFGPWLESGPPSLLAPYPAELMVGYPVSPLVNSPRHDGPECLRPLG
jgi:putative SOS response-associated peptidase YedK